MKRQPKIDDIVSLLQKAAPGVLDTLRSRYPVYHEILKEGEVLGTSISEEELMVRANVCFVSTDAAIKICDDYIPKLRRRLREIKRMQLIAQVITTIGGASVIANLALHFIPAAYFSGGLSLVGSLIPIFIDQRRKGIGEGKGIEETFGMIIQAKLEAERYAKELRFFIDNGFNMDGISDVINKCNVLCGDIMKMKMLWEEEA